MKNVSFLILLTLGLSACGGKHGAKTKSSQLFPFCNDGKCGYTNENGELVIDLKFSTASTFCEGVAKLANENNLYGFIDSSGNYVIEPQFEDARDFHEGLACVKKNNLYGFIDRKGNVVIDFQYSYGGDFIDSLALVAKGEVGAHSWGWINRNGETVIPFSYTYALPFKRGEKYTFVQPGNWAWTIIDRNDKSPCEGGFYNVDNLEYYIGFSDGLSPVIDENLLFGYVDENCSLVIPHQFEAAFRFNEGLAPAVKNGKVGLIDKKGNWVFEPKYASCNYFISEGLLGVKNENDNWGYVDSKGNTVINFEYAEVKPFRNGSALVCKGNYPNMVYYLIDKTGKKISEEFDEAFEAEESYSSVSSKDVYYLVSKGKKIGFLHSSGKKMFK